MKNYSIDLRNSAKQIYSGHIKLGGTNPKGDKISFTNYYMELNGKPFFGICGEFHFSRYDERYWEDELLKMKMCGLNVVATYIIWIHHEEDEGVFDWGGNKNIRHFVELCAKHGLYAILRVGPFAHGEARNGGLPDWLYGRPFEVRSNDEGYLFFARRWYSEIGKQVEGLMYKDGGAVIGVQIENEYMHSVAPWELTTGTSNEWLPGGRDGEDHMRVLKQAALEAGLEAPIYTCTAWGGAATPTDEMLPLWGGYAFWPWIFYGDVKEHPATPEYIFRDYHNNTIPKCYNFEPTYVPEDYPYACCEMGGGMTVFYKYRFVLPPESVEAMALIKVAGGCNFVGYYMFHGGTNPRGKHIPYLNEHAVPKMSYDYQAAIGEFGQVRESYQRLKRLHYFLKGFEGNLCEMKTILPEGTEAMTPHDTETLRYAARVKERSGFLFINNYQDHWEMKDQKDFSINLLLDGEKLTIPKKDGLTLRKDACCILPFNLDMDGILLKYSTTQLITSIEYDGEKYYFFFIPEGMKAEYCFEAESLCDFTTNGTFDRCDDKVVIQVSENSMSLIKLISKQGSKVNICTLTGEQSLNLWKVELWGRERIVITDATLIADGEEMRLECTGKDVVTLQMFPDADGDVSFFGGDCISRTEQGIFKSYVIRLPVRDIVPEVTTIKASKAMIRFNDSFDGLKEVVLRIDYTGDIGYAYIDGKLINDNFCNGAPWEIGLKKFERDVIDNWMVVHVSPIKKGSQVKSDSTMAGRVEVSSEEIAEIHSVKAVPVYEVSVR